MHFYRCTQNVVMRYIYIFFYLTRTIAISFSRVICCQITLDGGHVARGYNSLARYTYYTTGEHSFNHVCRSRYIINTLGFIKITSQ